MKQKFGLIFVSGILVTIVAVFFNASIRGLGSNVIIAPQTVKICDRHFTNFELVKAPKGVQLLKKSLVVKGLSLPVFAPMAIAKDAINLNVVATVSGDALYPLMPDVPILPASEQEKVCPLVKAYASQFANLKSAVSAFHNSKIFQIMPTSNAVQLKLKVNYQNEITSVTNNTQLKTATLKTLISTQYVNARTVAPKPAPIYDFIIIYQKGYESDVLDLATFYQNRNIRTKMIELSQLPGYNPNGPIPFECNGEFLNECYHFWGDPVSGVSQLAVASLPGFVSGATAFSPYSKLSYVPGLIRAYLRAMKKNHPLRGVLLVGSPQKIPPYNSETTQYYYDGIPWLTSGGQAPAMKLFTDLYYMVPTVPVVVDNTSLAHQIISPSIWSCTSSSGVRMDYWCNSNEWRFWSTPALIAYRNPPHVPHGKIFSLKYGINDAFWDSSNYSDVLPVGRIVTQDKFFGGHDEVVKNYVEKLQRWYRELPSINNGSINSNGGSTSDSWIFTKTDIDQFITTFGSNSKIYASEFFVSGYQCDGRCTFKRAEEIMSVMGEKNISALMLNGHGGHIAVQGPYGNGNNSSTYLNEGSTHFDDGIRLVHETFPTTPTLKQIESQGKLVGIVFANSCSPSDYLLANQMHYLFKTQFPTANERSWAEQWLAMEDAGALNTFLNGNVGWGGSDNSYNVEFMKRIKSSWQSCGTLGDAQRLLILDGLRGGSGIGSWQVYNRHFLGSPLNHIARLPWQCNTVVSQADLTEVNSKE